ncbi:hypothetical protein O6072_22830 [Mycolicibacterium neoaurum]|uniref:hypothetical protein n=1 Tax=Mycolicibacterium neoaurum TaxID=1795 RepID=UPI00248AE9B7|nr:hypothetical protein [Mycolicibacterium neoaurum]WBP93837.1 hypothetical protein O7W24_22325 [Mycolicibacterium neoaurum]WBS07630.1 hypothetical protein O6072_22830 [Mycolicibacterium neoaurum]
MQSFVAGTFAVVDMEAACALYGRDTLPEPLGRTRPVGSLWLLSRDMGPVENRLHGGDLHEVRKWVRALVEVEVCLELRVSFAALDTPDLRVHGLLSGHTGFIATQRVDREGVDVVDIAEVAPHALGSALSGSVPLVGAGTRIRVAVTGGERSLPAPPASADEFDDFGFLVPKAEPRDSALEIVDGRAVVSVGTLRSWHNPDHRWGGDPNRQVLQWFQIDDGDYLYAPGAAGYAEPMDRELLRTRIDEITAG